MKSETNARMREGMRMRRITVDGTLTFDETKSG
jgi:hypothetical protein